MWEARGGAENCEIGHFTTVLQLLLIVAGLVGIFVFNHQTGRRGPFQLLWFSISDMAGGCTAAQLQEVLDFVQDSAIAESVCQTVQHVGADVTSSLLQYAAGTFPRHHSRFLAEDDAAALVALNSLVDDATVGTNVSFLLFSAYLVFAMQAGFAMVACGSVRAKTVSNIMLKNVLDSAVGGVFYYMIGYGLQFGNYDVTDISSTKEVLGVFDFALSKTDGVGNWQNFLFQWAFAAAATTIVSGAVAERCTLVAYLGYSILLISWVYPVQAHWVWAPSGWLNAFRAEEDRFKGTGAFDFAGSGVVHMCGGTAALWGAYIIGPRIGRFDANGKPAPGFAGHNTAYIVLGTFLLWFGWYGFNPGSQLAITGVNAVIVARTAVTTTLAPAMAGFTAMMVKYLVTRHTYDVGTTCNGVLGGLVAITAPCATIMPWAAILLGFLVGLIVVFGEILLLKLRIDDPVGAVPVHMMSGAFGVLYTGFFAKPQFVCEVYGICDPRDAGVVYKGKGNLLLSQLVEVVCIFAWVSAHMSLFFIIFKKLGKLRVPAQVEVAGLDVSKHGGPAYVMDESPNRPNLDNTITVNIRSNHVMPFKG